MMRSKAEACSVIEGLLEGVDVKWIFGIPASKPKRRRLGSWEYLHIRPVCTREASQVSGMYSVCTLHLLSVMTFLSTVVGFSASQIPVFVVADGEVAAIGTLEVHAERVAIGVDQSVVSMSRCPGFGSVPDLHDVASVDVMFALAEA